MSHKITVEFPYKHALPDDGHRHIPFPKALDDAGLTVLEFRIYVHLANRAINYGTWPGVASMSRTCRIKKHLVIQSFRILEKHGLVRVVRKAGSPDEYFLTLPSEWMKRR